MLTQQQVHQKLVTSQRNFANIVNAPCLVQPSNVVLTIAINAVPVTQDLSGKPLEMSVQFHFPTFSSFNAVKCNLTELTTKIAVHSSSQQADALRRHILPWICQHVLSSSQGFASRLAILEHGTLHLSLPPSLPPSLFSLTCQCEGCLTPWRGGS